MPKPSFATTVAVWALALHLTFVGLTGSVTGLWPPRTDELAWRVLLETQFLAGMGQVLAAALLLLIYGLWCRSRPAVAATATFGFGFPILIGVVLVALGLDYLQMRSMIRPEMLRRWDLSVAIPALLGILASFVLLVLAIAGLKLRGRRGRWA